MQGNVGQKLKFCSELSHTHVGLYCNVDEKS